MRHRRGGNAALIALLASALLIAACKTVPDPAQGVADSGPDTDARSGDIGSTESVDDPFGPDSQPNALDERELTETELSEQTLSPTDDPQWLESRLETVYFDFDRASLTEQARASLERNAAFLQGHPDVPIRISGHCDERGTVEYNLALGDRRANTVREYLVQLGIDSARFAVVSFGEEQPADPAHGEAAWARNRRAEFHVR